MQVRAYNKHRDPIVFAKEWGSEVVKMNGDDDKHIGEHLLHAFYMPGTSLSALHVLILLLLWGFLFLNMNVAFCHRKT